LARLSQKAVHSLIADQILVKALIDLGWGAGQSEIAQAKTKGKKGGKQNSVHSRLHRGTDKKRNYKAGFKPKSSLGRR
jgi:hypothetical protein